MEIGRELSRALPNISILSRRSDFHNLKLGKSETISLNQNPEWHARVRPEMFG